MEVIANAKVYVDGRLLAAHVDVTIKRVKASQEGNAPHKNTKKDSSDG